MRYTRVLSICAAALAASVVTSIAADMPQKAVPYAAPASPSTNMFAGFYIGGHGGWTTGSLDFGGPSIDADGSVWGAHAGVNFQKGWFVGGLEVGITNYANVKPSGATVGCDCLVADLIAKAGVAVTPNLLVYAAGGGFWHNAVTGGFIPQFGWTAGGGFDWLPINDHIVIGARYLYRNLDVPNTPVSVTGHEFTGRVSYKF